MTLENLWMLAMLGMFGLFLRALYREAKVSLKQGCRILRLEIENDQLREYIEVNGLPLPTSPYEKPLPPIPAVASSSPSACSKTLCFDRQSQVNTRTKGGAL